jgi:DNA-directed RNA polymerase subunit alpha
MGSEQEESKESDLDLNPNLFKSIDELELSVRATNCLKAANIRIVGELVQRTEQTMLKTKNFGRKSLDEIRRVLDSMELKFGMVLEDFDKKHQEWLKRKEKNEA